MLKYEENIALIAFSTINLILQLNMVNFQETGKQMFHYC